jgi:hypothetical protein
MPVIAQGEREEALDRDDDVCEVVARREVMYPIVAIVLR